SNRQRRPISAVQAGFAPPIHEGNQRKVTDYGQELADEQRRAFAQLPPPSNPTSVQPNGPAVAHDRTDTETEWSRVDKHDPLMEKERERAYNARFSSNIAYAEQRPPSVTQDDRESAETTPARNTASTAPASNSRKPANVNVNSATGQPYVL